MRPLFDYSLRIPELSTEVAVQATYIRNGRFEITNRRFRIESSWRRLMVDDKKSPFDIDRWQISRNDYGRIIIERVPCNACETGCRYIDTNNRAFVDAYADYLQRNW